MEEFKMESFHPAEPLVASELPSPLVSKPPKEFADETSSTASEAATSASAAAVATIDHHHHHHHPVGNVSFFVLKAFSSRCDSCGLRRGSEAVFASQKSQKAKCEKTLRPTFHHRIFDQNDQKCCYFLGFGDQYFRPPFDQVLMATIGVLLMLKVLNL